MSDPYHLQKSIDDLVNLVFRQVPAFAQWKGDVLSHCERVKQRAILKNHGDFLTDRLHLHFVVVGHIFMRDNDSAGIGLQESHDVMQCNGLADTAAAQDAHSLTRTHVEADVVQHALVAERLAHVLEFDVGR